MQFTVEDARPDGSMSFLDILIKLEQNRTLSISVYKKAIHIDQYNCFDSHHNMPANYPVINRLAQMATVVCSTLQQLRTEKTTFSCNPREVEIPNMGLKQN